MKTARIARMAAAIAALALLTSCASQSALRRAQRELQRGDLTAATLAAAVSLSHKPKNYDALALLESSFPAAVASLEAEAAAAMSGEDTFRWETVADSWSSIHAMNDAVRTLPPLYRKGSKAPVVFVFRYDAELLSRSRIEAAEARYRQGRELMAIGTRTASKDAHASFAKALSYAPGYKDAAALAAQAEKLGSDRIAVLPFASAGDPQAAMGARALYDASVAAFVDMASRRDFLQVVDRASIDSMLAERELSASDLADPRARLGPEGLYGANILVTGQLLAYAPEYPAVRTKTETVTKEFVEPIPGAAPVNGIPPIQTVVKSAVVTVFTKTSALTVTAAYRAVDVETSVIVDARTLTESIGDEYRWAIYQGDKDALTSEYAALVKRGEADVRQPEAMLSELCSRLARQFALSFDAAFAD
jgi:hypothetical protein